MKKIYAMFALTFCLSMANATVHVIDLTSGMFTPSYVEAECGDTIRFNWISCTNCSSTTTSVPPTAAPWDSGVQTNGFTFEYVVEVEGTYEYYCVNAPTTMLGSVVVTCLTGNSSASIGHHSAAYPNPFSTTLTLEATDADGIILYNLLGEKVRTISLRPGQTKAEINVSDFPSGIYYCSFNKEGLVIDSRKIVKN